MSSRFGMKSAARWVCAAFALWTGAAQAATHVWELQEIEFEAAGKYANPYTEVECWIELKGPGFSKRIYSFWDGGQTFRIRFVTTAPGKWTWKSQSKPDDRGPESVKPGEIVVLKCRGPMGAGMEGTYQCTAALKDLEEGKHIALLTDARFSGVSTGACIGHISPEALAGGPLGKVEEGDIIEIIIDRMKLEGSINLVGANGRIFGAEEGTRLPAARPEPECLRPDPLLPDDTRLWAALQNVAGGPWSGSVYDVDLTIKALDLGLRALRQRASTAGGDDSISPSKLIPSESPEQTCLSAGKEL